MNEESPTENRDGPATDFLQWCEEERRQRESARRDFDATLFDEAAALVLRKLGALETKGLI